MVSVFQNKKECFACKTTTCLNDHHIFPGSRRKISEKYGFKVFLCVNHHTIFKESVHQNPNKGLDLELKQMAQEYYEEHIGTREDWMREFGKNYL